MYQKKLIIAIDGYSSCGKSSLAFLLAKDLGYKYIDTGAMYRAVTFFFINNNVNFNDEYELKENLNKIKLDYEYNSGNDHYEICLNGKNIEKEIRNPLVAEKVSLISALPLVREAMVTLQRKIGDNKGVVMDGRDIGTVVFPDAEVKIFMTADADVRAQRRYKELTDKGIKVNFEDVKNNVIERDRLDTSRKHSPLTKAKDAVLLDNSNLDLIGSLSFVKKIVLDHEK